MPGTSAENLEGLSFVPLLHLPDRAWKQAAFTVQKSGKVLGQSLRTERWRYTEWGGQSAAELYDEHEDPGEFTNLVTNPVYATQVRDLRELLRTGWRRTLPLDNINNK